MTTTEQRPAVPAFLNLDAVAPPDLRAEIEVLVPEAEVFARQVTGFAAAR